MRPSAVAAATASLLLTASLLGAPAQAQDAAAGTRDLQAVHDYLRDNAPQAAVDKDTATFRAWLDKGLQQSLAMASMVNTPNAYGYLLRGYSGGFRDSSIDAAPNWQPLPRSFAVDWPGFSTSWRDGGYYVAYVEPGARGLPPVGAKLLACDGKPIDEVARTRLDRYEGNLDLESDRVKTAPWLFWNRGNPFIGGHPMSCDFQVGGRGKRSIGLTYITSPENDRDAAYRAAAPVSDGRLAVEPWGQGRVWISAHSLTEGPALDAFFTQLDGQIDAVRNASVVVVDLRGASGATQTAGYRLLNHLWSPEYVKMHWPPANNVVFRVSKGNRDLFAGIAATLKADPKYATDRAVWDAQHDAAAIAAELDQALTAGKTVITIAAPTPPAQEPPAGAAPGAVPPPPPPPAGNPVKGKVVVLTDYACDAGCLSLMDVATTLPNVVQAGNTSGADTIFVEPVTVITGQARLTYPLRAWLDRPRASNVAYTPAPAMTWTGAYNDETGLKAWLDKAVAGAPAAPAAH